MPSLTALVDTSANPSGLPAMASIIAVEAAVAQKRSVPS